MRNSRLIQWKITSAVAYFPLFDIFKWLTLAHGIFIIQQNSRWFIFICFDAMYVCAHTHTHIKHDIEIVSKSICDDGKFLLSGPRHNRMQYRIKWNNFLHLGRSILIAINFVFYGSVLFSDQFTMIHHILYVIISGKLPSTVANHYSIITRIICGWFHVVVNETLNKASNTPVHSTKLCTTINFTSLQNRVSRRFPLGTLATTLQ